MTLIVLAACAVVFLAFLRARWMAAEPDEWLLRVRNGKVKEAGVGISIFRRPGDVVARFSSTIQRVRFTTEALTVEHLTVVVDGFVLWAVSTDRERAFRAFSKLGIANLERRTVGLKNRAHLLTSPQHHAFQALLAAEVRAHVSALSLEELLTSPKSLLSGLDDRLASLSETLGIVIERTEILEVKPADATLGKDLAAGSEERVRENAANARLEAAARLRQREAAHAKNAADEATLLRLAEAEGAQRVLLSEHEAAAARALEAERDQMKVFMEKRAREEAELTLSLDKLRRTADAERDASLARQAAEEQMSPAARDHELSKLVAVETSKAMATWHVQEARWVQMGDDSPLSAVAKAIMGMGELVRTSPPHRGSGS